MLASILLLNLIHIACHATSYMSQACHVAIWCIHIYAMYVATLMYCGIECIHRKVAKLYWIEILKR